MYLDRSSKTCASAYSDEEHQQPINPFMLTSHRGIDFRYIGVCYEGLLELTRGAIAVMGVLMRSRTWISLAQESAEAPAPLPRCVLHGWASSPSGTCILVAMMI